jgi:type I restriction enzyme R subunit
MLNEADTRAKLIDPLLHAAGWSEDRIRREHYLERDRQITRGRIYLVGDEPRRKEPKKVDYLLRYSDALPVAVVEAKDESHEPEAGIQQAKTYAQVLDMLFAYSTNGHGIVEFDFITNTQRQLPQFPTPDELWLRLTAYRTVLGRGGANPVLQPFCPPARCGNREPHYFQEVAVNRSIQAIMQGQKRLLLAMATGTGKTFVAFQIAWKLAKSRWLRRVLLVTDRNILRDNAYNTFSPFEDARFVISESQVNLNRDVYFAIYQALWSEKDGRRLFEHYPPDFFDLIIIDECHRSGFGTWNEILQHFPGAVQIGMTATPKRTDNIDTYDYFRDPVYEYSLGQGIEDGFLATYKVHKVRTNVDKDGLHIEDAQSQGAEIYVPDGAELRDVYHTPQFEREITLPDRIARMSEHLASLLRRFGPMQKSMIFCVDMDHAAKVAEHIQNHFSYLGYPDYAIRIVSEEADARELFEQFQDSDRQTPVVASTADLLTTGVDVPSARNIVFMKTVASPVVFKQIVGRGTRTDSATGKLWFRVIDYTNATRLFDDWDRPPGEPPEVYTGPRNCRLDGVVTDIDTGNPVENALVTVLPRPNEQLQDRTDASGAFAFSGLPEAAVTLIVTASGYRRRQLTVTTVEAEPQTVWIELRPEGSPAGKIRVKGLEVTIADEAIFVVERTGQQLTLREYMDHTRREVERQTPTLQTLREIWVDAAKRSAFLEALEQESIFVDVLAEVLNQPEADQFDLLASIAFGAPVRTRDERVTAFRNFEQAFLEGYEAHAREVLLGLLDKYRVAGVNELVQPEVFRVSPFDRMGQAPGVIERFGTPERLRAAIDEMQRRLYSM